MNNKQTFSKISFLYALVLITFSGIAYFYTDSADYKIVWITFLSAVMLLTIGYFGLLQSKIKKIENPPIVSLAAICLMSGLGIGIFVLLIIGERQYKSYMWAIFSIIYALGTIWTAKKLWIKIELRG